MTSPATIMSRMSAAGLDSKICLSEELAQSHYNDADEICQSSGITLPSDSVLVSMTPYGLAQSEEYYFMFEVVSLKPDCLYLEHSMAYAEATFDVDEDADATQQFVVYGEVNAKEVFGFLATQFAY